MNIHSTLRKELVDERIRDRVREADAVRFAPGQRVGDVHGDTGEPFVAERRFVRRRRWFLRHRAFGNHRSLPL